MENKSYLIFLQNNSFYGIEALSVREVFLLPEVTAIAEMPDSIIGVINLRGNILPLMDLNIRLGYGQRDYSLTDNVVVIEWQQFTIGIIVNEVYEVKNIPVTEIKKELYSYGNDRHHQSNLVTGLANLEDKLIILLSSKHLIQYVEVPDFSVDQPPKIDVLIKEKSLEKITENQNFSRLVFCPNATSKERYIFQERAKKNEIIYSYSRC